MVQFSDYFFPHPPQQWEADDIRRADELREPLVFGGVWLSMLSALGAVFSTYNIIRRKLKGNDLTSAVIYIQITCVALTALGIYLCRLGMRHAQGLTRERQIEVAVEELKESFDQLLVCESEDELEERLEKREISCSLASDAIKDVNRVYSLVESYYCPIKEVQPRFMVKEGLSMDQQQDLLDVAYHKGILLHFHDYEKGLLFSKEFPVKFFLISSKEYGQKCVKNLEQSFACSVLFLVKHLQPLDKDKVDFINEQLRALSFKWYYEEVLSGKEERVFNPTLYLEDAETVVIRGNCSEIGDPTWAIELLAPHIKNIKIEKEGLLFVTTPSLVSDVNWANFRGKLDACFPGKMTFVDALPDMRTIWQENI